ncbi:MAG: hypothetical protein QOJ99_5129 [Bryobacterales bacterium]|nr:hypothetical protein [Bryobacterales bacterium]
MALQHQYAEGNQIRPITQQDDDAHRHAWRQPSKHAGVRLIWRLLPSIADFSWLIPILFLFGRMNGLTTLLGDGDTGWHIRTGQWILANGRVPRQDIFSFTRPGQTWYAWEWLSDVLMGWLHQTGGMQAVLLGAILLICLTFGLVYRMILRKSGSVLISFVLTAIAAAGSSIHWLARPHLFTMLFLVVFYSVLEAKRTRLLFILPVATVIWTNLHGGFLAGIILICGYAGGELVAAIAAQDSEGRRTAAGRSGRYGLAAIGCMAATLINPYTWHLHAHLIRFLTNPAYFQNTSEFMSISFRHPLAPFFELMVLLGAATSFWSITQRRFVPLVLLAGWTHMALQSARHIPLFMIIAAPPIGLALAEWLELVPGKAARSALQKVFRAIDSLSARLNAADSGVHWHVVRPAAILLLGVMMYGHNPPPRLQARYDARAFPSAALAALRDSDRIFTSETWGGYLIYQRYPAKVFLDGRADFYGPEFVAESGDIMGVHYNWEARMAAYDIDTAVLVADAPLAGALKGSQKWRVVYDDGLAVVFRKRAPL